ncbi:MAG: CRTAC1 family protein [Thermoanaerobaculia bacterium]|nr:CRTAC1 family protein [Thermoanaerobaculia bacterium]
MPPQESHDVEQAAGTVLMARRLATIAESSAPSRNVFMNQERVALQRQQSLPVDSRERVQVELRWADELLRAGDSAEAIQILERLRKEAEDAAASIAPTSRHLIRSLLAVAYLRLGEQQNCLEQHSAEACLLPIRGGGVHRRQEASLEAMEILGDILRETPDDLTSRWLYNVAAMTVGRYPDGVADGWLVPPAAFESQHDISRFPDVASGVGLATVGLAGGSVVEDLDGDGYLDVMVSSWGLTDQLRLFLNRRDGTFEEQTAEAGLNGIVGGLNLVQADYDNDGDVDVLVLRGAWLGPAGSHPNSLLENLGTDADGRITFEDVTDKVGLVSFHPTQTAGWADFDNDGWLDLFVGNESLPGLAHPCELYRNNGRADDGSVTFTDIAREAGIAAGGFVKGVAWGDFDNDGWPDLYVSRLIGRNLLFRNETSSGSPSFREVGLLAGVGEPVQSFPTWFFDYDNDGWLDLFVAGYARSFLEMRAASVAADYLGLETDAERPRLYRNRGPGDDGSISFDDVSAELGLDRVVLAMGGNHGDLDNDGWLDIYLGTGAPDFRALVPNRMFRNAAGRAFQDVTTAGGFGHLQKGHGVSFADLDNDGDQDIFHVLGGAYSGDVYQNALFLNPGHGNRWITLRLEGTRSNRSALGARLALEIDTGEGLRKIHVTVGSGGSFGASSLQQEIGLGDAKALRRLEISWPGGDVQALVDLPMNRVLHIREGDNEPREIQLERLDLAHHRLGYDAN